jgi:ABC-type transport system involved in cytochrome bd biosynthesis fused ATPase/permease subunit
MIQGKSSFVNVILGKVVKTAGILKVNGETVKDMSKFQKVKRV